MAAKIFALLTQPPLPPLRHFRNYDLQILTHRRDASPAQDSPAEIIDAQRMCFRVGSDHPKPHCNQRETSIGCPTTRGEKLANVHELKAALFDSPRTQSSASTSAWPPGRGTPPTLASEAAALFPWAAEGSLLAGPPPR